MFRRSPSSPLFPYTTLFRSEPTAADPWDLRKVAHLHRRAGFGVTWNELERDRAAGPSASVDRFLHPAEATAEQQQILDGLRHGVDRKSTRLNSSHVAISYAV